MPGLDVGDVVGLAAWALRRLICVSHRRGSGRCSADRACLLSLAVKVVRDADSRRAVGLAGTQQGIRRNGLSHTSHVLSKGKSGFPSRVVYAQYAVM